MTSGIILLKRFHYISFIYIFITGQDQCFLKKVIISMYHDKNVN